MKMKSFRFAAALAVLLAFCLVFAAPVGAAEAQIGTTEYSTLEDAFSAVNSANDGSEIIIKLLSNVDLNAQSNSGNYKNEALVLDRDKVLILDLNGHNLSVSGKRSDNVKTLYAISNYGELTVKDSSSAETGVVYSRGIQNFGVMSLESGTIISCDTDAGAGIWNEGTLTINGGTLKVDYVGTVSTDSGPSCLNNNGGTAVINGGEFITKNLRCYAIISSGTLTINNAVVATGSHGCVGITGGTVTINEGTFTADKYYALYSSGGSIEVYGGTFISKSSSGNALVYVKSSSVILNGGKFGTTDVESNGNIRVSSGGNVVISGGEYTGDVTVNNDDATLSIIGGKFKESNDIENYIKIGYKLAEGKVSASNPVAKVGDAGYASLQDAVDAAAPRSTITVQKEDITLTEKIQIKKPLTITGGDSQKTISSTAQKIFEVYEDATFKNLKLTTEWRGENSAGGRCIDTRVGGITVNIKDCVLETTSAANNQPLTVGGYGKDIVLNLNKVTISAGNSGYGVTTFNPVILKVTDSSITGYAAFYFKPEDNSLGSQSSKVTVTNSEIKGINSASVDPSNAFGTFVFESGDVEVTLNDADVAHAISNTDNPQHIFSFYKSTGNKVTINSGVTMSATGGSDYFVRPFQDNAGDNQNTVIINAGVTSTFPIDSKYLAAIEDGKLACVATKTDANGVVTEYTVQAVSEETVAPETPTVTTDGSDNSVISKADNPETTITKTDEDKVTIELPSDSDSTDAPKISIVITGVDTDGAGSDGSMNSVAIPDDAEIVAKYENLPAAVAESESQATVALELKIADVAGTLPVIDSSINDDVVKTVQEQAESTVTTTVLAMITAVGEDRNSNLVSGDDDKKITITFTVPASVIENLKNLVAYHVSADNELTVAQMDDPVEDGENYIITIYGKHFSSYVLVEEEPKQTVSNNNGGGKDTGSGNYQYYPRDVPTSGIIDFGTSKVVKGMELPAGSSGKVTLNTKPTFAMPENGFYAFEIDAPGYNLDAKINGGLSFQIPLADLEAAGYTAKDIVLYHGTVAEDGKITWEALPTNLVKNENGIAYYKSAINGCSPFYIGFVKDGSVVNTEVVDPVTPPTDEPQDVPGEVLPEIPDVPVTPEEPSSPAPLFAVLAALGAAVVLRRK